ncbi:MAG: exonuclease SbcCD subunit D [Chloroflexota bacterium]
MRLLHFADLHLGVESYGNIDPETGLSTRLIDSLNALDQVVDHAVAERFDLVLFCGDAYQKRDPSQTHQREFARRLKRLSKAGIPAVLIVGNHDLPNAASRANSVEIFPTLGVDNILVSSRPEVINIVTPGGPIQVASLPWGRRSTIITREETKGLTQARITEEIEARLTGAISDLADQLDPTVPSVLAGHIFVSGAKLGSEASMTMGKDPVILPSNIALPQFDYVALGHIHRQQMLATDPPVCYSGSLVRLDFSDEDLDKGFYLIEFKVKAKARSALAKPPEFVAIETRRFTTVKATIPSDDPAPTVTVLKAVEARRIDTKNAIVKVEITVPNTHAGLIQDKKILDACQDAHHVTIARHVTRETRPRLDIANAEQLTPAQALKLYLERQSGLSPSRKQTLLKHGNTLINQTLSSSKATTL